MQLCGGKFEFSQQELPTWHFDSFLMAFLTRFQVRVVRAGGDLGAVQLSQSAVRRSFQPLRGSRIYSVNVVNFQWTVFISDFMHMRDKTVCGF